MKLEAEHWAGLAVPEFIWYLQDATGAVKVSISHMTFSTESQWRWFHLSGSDSFVDSLIHFITVCLMQCCWLSDRCSDGLLFTCNLSRKRSGVECLSKARCAQAFGVLVAEHCCCCCWLTQLPAHRDPTAQILSVITACWSTLWGDHMHAEATS